MVKIDHPRKLDPAKISRYTVSWASAHCNYFSVAASIQLQTYHIWARAWSGVLKHSCKLKVDAYPEHCSNTFSHLLIQDISVADVENEISQIQLQKLHVTSRLKGLQQSLDEMNISTHEQNELISKSEGLITRNNALIERKQTQIDQMNKKIDHKLSSIDGVSWFTALQELLSVASYTCIVYCIVRNFDEIFNLANWRIG